MRQIKGKRSHRRTKVYVIEATIKDFDLEFEFDEDGEMDVDVVAVERHVLAPVLAHGPEQAVRRVIGIRQENVEGIRRIRSKGLLRAILTPDNEIFDLHRGELEEQAGL